jgi:hypothetical protein
LKIKKKKKSKKKLKKKKRLTNYPGGESLGPGSSGPCQGSGSSWFYLIAQN